jgi:hypothetical protein
MKTFFLTPLLLLFLSASSLLALDNYPFSVGASIVGKVGVNAASTPSGIQNAVSFLKGIDAAAMVYLPMSDESRTGVFVELGYTNTPFGVKEYSQQQFSYINQKWLTISPIVMMSGLAIGLEFGFDAFNDYIDENQLFGNIPFKEDFNVSLRIGYMQPLLFSPVGVLNFIINGTYNITGSNYGDYTYNPATISLGLNYLFNIAIGDSF